MEQTEMQSAEMEQTAKNNKNKTRVAVVSPYWTFWEASAGGRRLRDDRLEFLKDAAKLVVGDGSGDSFDLVLSALLDSPETAASAAERSGGDIDVVLLLVTMAAPPTHAMAFLDLHEETPVVIWAAQRAATIRDGFDASDITSGGTAVGTPQITNMFARTGRPFELVVGPLNEVSVQRKLRRLLKLAGAASVMRRSKLIRLGRPPAGYDCVDVENETLAEATGIRIVDLPTSELRSRWLEVPSDAVGRLRAEAEAATGGEIDWDEGALRSLAGAAALERLDEETGAAAGAINCHTSDLRFCENPGVTPCYGLGRETSRGIPWTCAGDVLTAVAMLAAKRLGGASLYHEVEAIDFETGEVALANSGEHDLSWGPRLGRCRLQPNPWYKDDPLTGASMWFELPPGPASLVGFTPHSSEDSGFRFVIAEGRITERSLPSSPTVGGCFRFSGESSAAEAWSRWAIAGVNHHSAAAPGHLAEDLEVVAKFLGVGCVRVS